MLSQQLLDQLRKFFRRAKGIQLAYVFGSTVKGRKAKPRDLDVAVLFTRPSADPLRRLARQTELSGQLQRLTGQPVDLVVLNTASVTLHQQVLRYGILLYESRWGMHGQFQVRKLNEYFDLQPLRKFYQRRLDRQLGLK